KKVFFKTTFTMMGYIAKLDGRVSEKEIQVAREAMAHLQLSPEQKKMAIDYFNQGKSPQFDFTAALDNFVKHCGRQPQLVQLFVEIQIQAALVDGQANRLKHQVLLILCDRLKISHSVVLQMEAQRYNDQAYTYQKQEQYVAPNPQDELAKAFALIGVPDSATHAQVKTAYRKLMSQHHPDKLVAKGLPNEMIKVATEKVQRIQAAYDLICKYRAWH
ncbi:MAG: co-chaperone DjlA, partial [Candidatus Berkiella sp.]